MPDSLRRLSRTGWRLLRGHPDTWRHLRFELHNRPLLFKLRHLQRARLVPGLVSIITPTCGRLQTLEEAIASVDAQHNPHWEHLIISDGVFPAVQQLSRANHEHRRQFLSTAPIRHFGNHQRNVGIFRSRGEFLLFLDDDNILYPDALTTMLQGFSSAEVGLVLCPIDYDHAKHDVHGQVLMPAEGFQRGEIDSLNAMMRRSLAVQCRGWGDSYFADYDLLSQAAKAAPTCYLNGQPIGHHR
jgi:glycosyltransferase involved in cell wall biosynthesis